MTECTCPNCKRSVKINDEDLEFYKTGRQAKCPKCKKTIIFTKQPANLIRDKKGNLIRRKNRRFHR